MPSLQLEHAIKNYEMWKAVFDRDPVDRRALGVRRHRVLRPLDDANCVVVELDFDTTGEAQACEVALQELWSSRQAAPPLAGAPRVRIVETAEDKQY